MTLKKKSDDQISSDQTGESVEIHEAFKLTEYFAILKSKKSVGELLENNTTNDKAFKNFEELIKTAKYRKHES